MPIFGASHRHNIGMPKITKMPSVFSKTSKDIIYRISAIFFKPQSMEIKPQCSKGARQDI
jgi:hypothetical protein